MSVNVNLDGLARERRAACVFGFSALAAWASVGFALEVAHAFKWSSYLDHPLRRELLTWAHAHGVGLALVVLAYAAVGVSPHLAPAVGQRLRAAAWLMPLGFLASVLGHGESDPGPAILAVPVGAALLIASLVQIARAAARE
jgi:hypothetical protein